MENNPIPQPETQNVVENAFSMEVKLVEECFEEDCISRNEQGEAFNSNVSSSNSSGVSLAEANDSMKEGMKMVRFTAKIKRLPGKVRNRKKDIHLRRKICPKSPHKAINELKDISIKDYSVRNVGMKYFAKAIINSKPYMVEADSKSAAVNLLFENALREYYVAKSLVKPKPDGDSTDQNDEFPMMNLVCLALFKLFGEWTSKGYEIPKLNPDSEEGNDLTLKNKDETREKKIVQKWNEKHPVSLLYELFPNVNMQSKTTTSPDCTTLVHQMSLTLDGATFKASASNKKLAKRRVAIQVLNEVAGTEYTE